jgi:predicted lipid-binding transport protein (Tim44 family)
MPLPRRVASILLVAGIGAATGLLAGCDRTGVKPATWAKAVCSALSPWRAQLAALTEQTQGQLTSTTTPVQAKQNLVGLLGGAEAASEAARRRVVEAGTPQVDGGEDIAGRFVASLRTARDAYAHARDTVTGLDAGDAQAFYAAVAQAFEKLQQEYARSALDTDKVSSAALRKAFNEVPECH